MRKISASILLALTIMPFWAGAKDLAARLGVGYSDQFALSTDLPSLAVRYYPNQDYGLMGSLGVDTEKGSSRFGFQAKILKLVFKEDNMNFYTGAGAGLISREINNKTDAGFDISGFFGGEFFLPGLDSLGFNFEAGIGVTSVSHEVRFRTVGDHPLRAGMFFYF